MLIHPLLYDIIPAVLIFATVGCVWLFFLSLNYKTLPIVFAVLVVIFAASSAAVYFGTEYVDYDDGETVCIENILGGTCTYSDGQECHYYNDRSNEACREKGARYNASY